MSAFVDTSALYALLDESDAHHAEASDILRRLAGAELVTHAFVVVESSALVGRRLPWAASERLIDGILPVIDVEPVDADLYAAAVASYRQSGSARVSLVDHASFALMRTVGISRAFAFDDDFAREGFELIV
jgi:predicted nucleic acid-binding protein